MPSLEAISALHIAALFCLTGFIWTIQLIQYPSLRGIEATRWREIYKLYTRKTAMIIIPLMCIELGTALILVTKTFTIPHAVYIFCSAFTWALTLFVFIPIHMSLSHRPDMPQLRKLVRLNWLRTMAWSTAAAIQVLELLPNSPF